MFRERSPQGSLWQSELLVPPKKARRLEQSWAEVFRKEALPLIDEERFAPMYCAGNLCPPPCQTLRTPGFISNRPFYEGIKIASQ